MTAVKMTLKRAKDLLVECEADLAHARRIQHAGWIETLSLRRSNLLCLIAEKVGGKSNVVVQADEPVIV